MNQNDRSKEITKVSIIGIIANIFLASFKVVAGIISGSISIVLDAVNNMTDTLSSIITIAGIKLAGKRPDDNHPFGYGRIEYFSAIIIAAMVLTAGGVSLIEAIKSIFNPEIANYDTITIIIIVVAVISKIVLGKFVKAKGISLNSDALVASGSEASFDAILSLSTLVGAVVTLLFNISIDGYIATIISCFIVKAGFDLLLESINNVIGVRPDSEITKAIKASVNELPEVMGTYDLIIHNYGPDTALGSLHIEVSANMSAENLHNLTKKIQSLVLEKYSVVVTVGFYAIDDSHADLRKQIQSTLITSFDGVQGVHGIYIDDDQKIVSFDTVVDFTVHDREALEQIIKQEVAKLLPAYTIFVNFDTNYTA